MSTQLRKAVTALAISASMAAFLLVTPESVFAANQTDPDGNVYASNLAGRPITGYSANGQCSPNCPLQWDGLSQQYISTAGSCHGIAYGNYAGTIVLLTAYHCRGNSTFDNKFVYGPNGSKIGYWQPDTCAGTNDCAKNRDLAVIILYDGNWPAYRNRIIAGDPAQGQYWTVTADPSSAYSCGNLNDGSEWGDVVLQAFQRSAGTVLVPRTGTLTNMFEYDGGTLPNHCLVQTSLTWQGNGTGNSTDYRDSATPWRLNSVSNSVHFFTTGRTDPGYYLYVSPLYDGLDVLDRAVGFHLCHSSSCP